MTAKQPFLSNVIFSIPAVVQTPIISVFRHSSLCCPFSISSLVYSMETVDYWSHTGNLKHHFCHVIPHSVPPDLTDNAQSKDKEHWTRSQRPEGPWGTEKLRAQALEPNCGMWVSVLPLTGWTLGKVLVLFCLSFPMCENTISGVKIT